MSFQKINDSVNPFTGLITIVLTIVGIIIGYQSCNISEQMLDDHNQLNALNILIAKQSASLDKQDNMISKQQEQLGELKIQTLSAFDLITESKKLNASAIRSANDIASQLAILSDQQKKQLKAYLLTRKVYLTRLHYKLNKLYEKAGLVSFNMSLDQQLEYVQSTKDIFSDEITNPILLENDSLFFKWSNTINLADLTKKFLSEKNIAGAYTVRSGLGKMIIDTNQKVILEYRKRNFDAYYWYVVKIKENTLDFVRKEYEKLHMTYN